MNHKERGVHWQIHISQWQETGLSFIQFCKQHWLVLAQFYIGGTAGYDAEVGVDLKALTPNAKHVEFYSTVYIRCVGNKFFQQSGSWDEI